MTSHFELWQQQWNVLLCDIPLQAKSYKVLGSAMWNDHDEFEEVE